MIFIGLAIYLIVAALYGGYMFWFWRHNNESHALRVAASIVSGAGWPD